MQVNYSIKDLSQLTRIKPHTLRIWEQRYGMLKPERSDTNIRQYTKDDLKYLLNVSQLYDNGHKISHIAKLSKEELCLEVKKMSGQNLSFGSQIQNLIVCMLEMDEERFENQLSSFVYSNGLEETMEKLIFPFLQQVGILWMTNTVNPAQEHFITNLIRKKLFVAIDGLCSAIRPEGKKFLLFLPEGELHEIGLLFTYYMLRARGHKVIYLGQSLPLGDLEAVQIHQKADVAISIITSNPSAENVEPYLHKLSKALSGIPVWVTGFQVLYQKINLPPHFQLISNPEGLKTMLSEAKFSA